MTDPITVRARASSLPSYLLCARRWAVWHALTPSQRTEFGIRHLDTHIGAAVGSSVHAGAAHLMTEFQRTGDVGGRARVEAGREVAIGTLQDIWREGITWDPITRTGAEAERAVSVMVPTYHASIDPTVQPVLIESGLKMTLLDDMEITGHVDLFLIDGILEDLKTGRHRPKNFSQYGVYSLLVRSNGYNVGRQFREKYMPRVASGKPQPEPILSLFDQGVIEHEAVAVAKAIRRDVEQFNRTGDPDSFLANSASWICKDSLCPAFGSSWCHAWRGKVDAEGE